MSILCSISTKGRYHTTLPLAIMSVINQTRRPDKLIIYDDNDKPEDMRNVPTYQHIFQMLDYKGIKWEWVFAAKKGQHYNHQLANTAGFDWVWRMDDDTVAESNVLDVLYAGTNYSRNVGAVGGSILTPPATHTPMNASGHIENIDNEPNIQWGPITTTKAVDHLHCSFLYKAGIMWSWTLVQTWAILAYTVSRGAQSR